VTTWLHRIVVNACFDNARRRSARPTDPLRDEPEDSASGHDSVEQRETSLAVIAALRTLPTEQAAAVVLVDIEGYPVAEAAEILDVPTGTVKSRCARGRARLADQLTDLDPRRPARAGGEPGAAAVTGADDPQPPVDRNDAPSPDVQPEVQFGEEPA
jgi:RNA polymerase sigma-70 factor (ECF subfamily)